MRAQKNVFRPEIARRIPAQCTTRRKIPPMKRYKMLILLPDGKIHKLEIPPFIKTSFREAPLTAAYLAALVPSDLPIDVRICDESVSRVPASEPFDIVCISIITGTANRGYYWADYFRSKGAKVSIGGVHATLLPDEAAAHADTISTGFGEKTFPELCRDFVAGQLKPRYAQPPGPQDLSGIPFPRRDLLKKFGYMMPNSVFATRGCRNRCDFCAVVGANFGWSTRPVQEVIDEVRTLPGKHFAFNDVSLCEDREYALELCHALKPLKKKWGGLMTTKATADEELMNALEESGCSYMLLGFESVMRKGLYSMRKGFNSPDNYFEVCRRLHERGIIIQGCFIFGLEGETMSIFQDTVDAVNELHIDIPRYAAYTPFPGTECYRRLNAENRILHRDWSYYDTQHVVIRPRDMSPLELDEGLKLAWRETFSLKSIRHRLSTKRSVYAVALAGNLAYRVYLPKLMRDKDRFPEGLDVTRRYAAPAQPDAGTAGNAGEEKEALCI